MTSYMLPLQMAYERMKRALFAPFEPTKWIVVGFSAWLAWLSSGGAGPLNPKWKYDLSEDPLECLLGWPGSLMSGFHWGLLLAPFVLAVVLLGVLLLWISSRAAFVFLDNVVRDKAEVVSPWQTYRQEGNSLFVWRLGFILAVLFAFASVVGGPLLLFGGIARLVDNDGARLGAVLGICAGLLAVGIPTAYAALFLDAFVVPIMYRDRIGATAAWKRFLPLLRSRLADFVLYGLFVLALAIASLIAIAAAGCMTLCVGFLLLWIPYVGSVAVLPLTYTYRALGPEFLAQFGGEFSVWASTPSVMPPEAASPGSEPAPPSEPPQ